MSREITLATKSLTPDTLTSRSDLNQSRVSRPDVFITKNDE